MLTPSITENSWTEHLARRREKPVWLGLVFDTKFQNPCLLLSSVCSAKRDIAFRTSRHRRYGSASCSFLKGLGHTEGLNNYTSTVQRFFLILGFIVKEKNLKCLLSFLKIVLANYKDCPEGSLWISVQAFLFCIFSCVQVGFRNNFKSRRRLSETQNKLYEDCYWKKHFSCDTIPINDASAFQLGCLLEAQLVFKGTSFSPLGCLFRNKDGHNNSRILIYRWHNWHLKRGSHGNLV